MARGGFRGGYGGMNQANVMKQAQKMQQDFLRMQKELEEKEFTAKSGGGMVSATVNGNREVTKIEIKPEACGVVGHDTDFLAMQVPDDFQRRRPGIDKNRFVFCHQ